MSEEPKNDAKGVVSGVTSRYGPASTAHEVQPEPADDLQALLERAALNVSTYKEFVSGPRTARNARKGGPCAAPNQAEQNNETKRRDPANESPRDGGIRKTSSANIKPMVTAISQESRSSRSAPTARGLTPASPELRGSIPLPRQGAGNLLDANRKHSSNGTSGWSSLNRVLSNDVTKTDEHFVQAVTTNISVPTLFVFSTSGGTGKTTILATLGRCLAGDGERVLVAETAASSLLPFYFGAQTPSEGELQSFLMADQYAGVDILSGLMESAGSDRRSQATSEGSSLISILCSAAARASRVLLDVSSHHAQEISSLDSRAQFGLVLIVPDLNCVVGAMNLHASLQAQRHKTGGGRYPYYLLNKFDSSLAFHRSIRSSLEDKLGDQLLPLTIRRSDALPEAMADGTTVIDYCPEAGIVEDFVSLSQWLSQQAPASRLRESD